MGFFHGVSSSCGDRLYEDKDILDIGRKFYPSTVFGIDDILERSSLYEQPEKYPCMDID